jgi:hypothetical protein
LTKPHLPHLKFDLLSTEYLPIWLAQPNDGSGRVFVVNSKGSVHAVGQSDPFFSVDAIRANNPVISVTVDSSVVLQPASAVPDFRDLISIAFPPHFESRAYFYVSYHKTDGSVQVEKFTAEESPDRFDPTSRTIIGSVWVPPSGGQLVFGPGGVLYMNRGGPITSAMPQAFFSDPDAVSNKLISILTEPDEDPAPTDNAASWAFAYDWASADQSTRTGLIEYRGPGRRMQGLHVFGTRAGQFGAVTSVNGNLINEILAEPLFSFVPITIAPPPPVFYPFDITALGEDEPGSLYVATYGRPVFFSQTEPPQYQGGVYKVSDTESAFEMAITAAQTGESVSLEWYAAAGWIYQVQRTADFQTWDPVGQPVTGNSEVSTFTDTTPLKVFFYRIAATTSLN